MGLRLRGARAADAGAVAALNLASLRDVCRGTLPDEFLDASLPPLLARRWQVALSAPRRDAPVLLALLSTTPAGFVAVQRRDTVAELTDLHVRPGYRGAGIGRKLLAGVAERMRRLGCRGAEVIDFSDNFSALRFCRALGATVGPEEPGACFGQEMLQRRCAWADLGQLVIAASSYQPTVEAAAD